MNQFLFLYKMQNTFLAQNLFSEKKKIKNLSRKNIAFEAPQVFAKDCFEVPKKGA